MRNAPTTHQMLQTRAGFIGVLRCYSVERPVIERQINHYGSVVGIRYGKLQGHVCVTDGKNAVTVPLAEVSPLIRE